jgi:hypothetical protein
MADQIKHDTDVIVGVDGNIANSALADSGVTGGAYGSDNTTLHSFTVDAKGRVTAASEASINVTGITYANTNAAGAGTMAHAPNQKIYISSSAPNSDSIGSDGDIWYQTL